MGLLERVNAQVAVARRRDSSGDPLSIDDWAAYFTFGGLAYPLIQTTMGGVDKERIPVTSIIAHETNVAVFSLVLARVQAFSQVAFQWTRFVGSMPGDLWGTPELKVLEKPWPGGHTAGLLARMEIDNCIAGNAYIVRPRKNRLARLRPDRVTIVLGSQTDAEEPSDAPDIEVAGYFYMPRSGRGRTFFPDEICHYAPMPDPVYQFLGMSWMTPAIREIQADTLATEHKARYFENAATPNLAIKFDPNVPIEHVRQFKALLEEDHGGAWNAYKCVKADTPVTMWDGRQLRADEIRPGDLVAAWSSEAEPGVVTRSDWQPASPIVTIRTQRGRVLQTTRQHPYLARQVIRYRGLKGQARGPEAWVSAEELRSGDAVRIGLGWAHNVGKHDAVTPEQGWVLGALTGDAHVGQNTPVFSAADAGIVERMRHSYQLKKRTRAVGEDYYVLGVRSLCDQMGMLGKRSWEKRIPAAVMAGSAKVQSAYLSGLIDTDGHVSDPTRRRSAEIGITSTSLELLRDAQHLLAGLGINASVSTPPSMAVNLPGEGLHRHQGHRLHVHGNDQAAILAGLLDLACEAKTSRLAEYASRPSPQRRSLYDRVVSVEIGPPERTIGIEVAEHHTHITGGIVTHNTLYLGGGADPVPVGSNFQQLDFANTQGKGESRLAAAAGVPPSWVGFSEGLQGSSLNAGNFQSARRRFSDGTMWWLWMNAAGSLENVLNKPPGARLWFDSRVPFMRDDATDIAAIQSQQAQFISTLVQQGFKPDTVVKALANNDISLLEHSGMLSVQLQEPGTQVPGSPSSGSNGNGNGTVGSNNGAGNGSAGSNGKPKGPTGAPSLYGA